MRFVILGGGPGGYAAAATAADLGAEVTIIERRTLGGNWTVTDGIPSKTLLHTAQVMASIELAESVGIQFEHGRPRVDLLRTIAYARWVAAHQARGVRERLDGIEATIIYGDGRLVRDGLVEVRTDDGVEEVAYDRLLICTGARRGSRPSPRSTTSASSTPATCSISRPSPSISWWSERARRDASSPSSSPAAACARC